MRRSVSLAAMCTIPFVSLCSQKPAADSARKASSRDSTVVAAPATLPRVQVRATRRRTPGLGGLGSDDRTTRSEAPAFELIDALSKGRIGALLDASPEFVRTASGSFSLMGGPGESNQVTLGGVRMPAGMVTGALNATIATSPWDVSNGGAAGATTNIAIDAGSRFRASYLVLRSSASGVPASGSGAARGLNLPLQLTAVTSGELRVVRYNVNAFASRDAVSLRRWDAALAPATRSILDSIARVAATPLRRAAEVSGQYGLIARFDLANADVAPAPTRSSYVTTALTRTSDDGGSRGLFSTGSTGATTVSDVAALLFDTRRILGGTYRLLGNTSVSTTASRVQRASDGPSIQFSDSASGAIIATGGAVPQPATRLNAGDARAQLTWYSADNRRRYLLQLQGRYEDMRVGSTPAQSRFVVASSAALASGDAVAMTRTDATAATRASTLVLAPAASVGFDLGQRGSVLLGARVDAWSAWDVARGTRLRGLDVLPRLSFQRRVGKGLRGAGAFGTVRGGVGRFVDWPALQQWSPAWRGASGDVVQCVGAAVPHVDVESVAPACTGSGTLITRTGQAVASPSLAPVSSTRGDLSLQIPRLTRFLRADIGVAASRYDRVPVTESAWFGQSVAGTLDGEGARAVLVAPVRIGADGIVPVAPTARAAPVFASSGRSTGWQYRLRLATRDVWARRQLEANYSYNDGRTTTGIIAPARSGPALVSSRSAVNRHTVMASIGSWLGVSQVRATLIARSGTRFTPVADRDLNGDGIANDAAFVPADRAEGWAAALPSSVRGCVRAAAGRILSPNACGGPWTISSMLIAQVPGPQLGLSRHLEVTVQLSNPAALLAPIARSDRVTFGNTAFVDPRLVRVTGFDQSAQRFRTELLQNFGRPVGLSNSVTDPTRIAVSVRIPLGRSSFDRRMDGAVRGLASDTSPASRIKVGAEVIAGLPNVPEVFLKQVTHLQLTREQRAELQSLATTWAGVTPRAIAGILPRSASDLAAREALLSARSRAIAQLVELVRATTRVFTPDQIASLEPFQLTLLNLRIYRWAELSPYPL